MKKLVLILALGITLAFSANSFAQTSNSDKKSKKESTVKTIELTYDEFVKRVSDIKNNPTKWNYLGDKPAIVDFYANWCGPCKKIAPILEELATKYEGEIYVYKVNTDKEPGLSAAFGIRSLPSLLFIPMKGEPQMTQGALPKASLESVIANVLLKK